MMRSIDSNTKEGSSNSINLALRKIITHLRTEINKDKKEGLIKNKSSIPMKAA